MLMTEEDIEYARARRSVRIPLNLIDSKGYKSKEYSFKIKFDIKQPIV